MQFLFTDHTLDTDRRELRRAGEPIDVEPQVLDVLIYLVENRERVVSKDDLIASVWEGRIVSDATAEQSDLRRAEGARRHRPRPEADPHHPRVKAIASLAQSARRRKATSGQPPRRDRHRMNTASGRARRRHSPTVQPSRCCLSSI